MGRVVRRMWGGDIEGPSPGAVPQPLGTEGARTMDHRSLVVRAGSGGGPALWVGHQRSLGDARVKWGRFR
jgi:hypothetical protein